jgi:hypothetical protein
MRAPILLRPRALMWSMKGVPWWGHVVALAAGGGALLLEIYVANGFYFLAGFIVLFAVGVLVADRRYRRRRR